MEDRNLVEEMMNELDDTGKFLFGLIVLTLLNPEITEKIKEKAYKK